MKLDLRIANCKDRFSVLSVKFWDEFDSKLLKINKQTVLKWLIFHRCEKGEAGNNSFILAKLLIKNVGIWLVRSAYNPERRCWTEVEKNESRIPATKAFQKWSAFIVLYNNHLGTTNYSKRQLTFFGKSHFHSQWYIWRKKTIPISWLWLILKRQT